ncbi:uncharacterized protein SCHCODRAFT_02496697 [Schizophyllum commune H4-8]|nr:uncharacterized protein SCHCODRAFT_02496697 [Schizophyllum commune H4-8]KAI5894942.1 hypothetical protein SCHCODRAFT_02496697 [Schizophyllum commune H4-8]
MFWGPRRIEAARPSVSTRQQAPSAPAFCRAVPSAGLTAAERAAALDPGVVASQCDRLAKSRSPAHIEIVLIPYFTAGIRRGTLHPVLCDGGDRGWPFCSGTSAVRLTLTIYHPQDLCIPFVAVGLHLQGHGEVYIDKRIPYIYDSIQYIDKANPIASLLGYAHESDFAEMEILPARWPGGFDPLPARPTRASASPLYTPGVWRLTAAQRLCRSEGARALCCAARV